jgi:uncharacterized protein (TIGR03435 family)
MRRRIVIIAASIALSVACLFVLVLTESVLRAQATARETLPSFEVVSIKPDPANLPGTNIDLHLVGQEYIGTGLTAEYLIELAYAVKEPQISGGASWISSKKYLLNAKIDDATFATLQKLPRDQRRLQEQLLFQSLLADRFRLKISHSIKEGPVFALVVAKSGPKITLTKDSSERSGNDSHGHNGVNTAVETNEPMSGFAAFLSTQREFNGRVVLDRTGLRGNYDFTLKWTTQFNADAGHSSAVVGSDAAAPSIWTAVQEQLGLRLVSTTGPIDTVVIDHIEEPSPN